MNVVVSMNSTQVSHMMVVMLVMLVKLVMLLLSAGQTHKGNEQSNKRAWMTLLCWRGWNWCYWYC